MTNTQKQLRKCDYPECDVRGAKRIDIPTSWFRGDDVVLYCCKPHRGQLYFSELLKTDKAKRQME
jgi:hypothetical protein